jgi:hypothetical protein
MRGFAAFAVLANLCLAACAQAPARAPEAAGAAAAGTEPSASDMPEFERSLDTITLTPGQPIRFENPYGDVRLRFGGYQHLLEWRGVYQQGEVPTRIALEAVKGETFTIQARLPKGATLAPTQRVDITAYVPHGHDVSVATERGLIEARGLTGNFQARSASGPIAFRGIGGTIDIETGAGAIEGQLDPVAPGSRHRIINSTGNIVLGLPSALDAELSLSTSGVYATEFSLEVTPLPGQEPNKQARAVIGKAKGNIEVASRRGEIRLLRRAEFRAP